MRIEPEEGQVWRKPGCADRTITMVDSYDYVVRWETPQGYKSWCYKNDWYRWADDATCISDERNQDEGR